MARTKKKAAEEPKKAFVVPKTSEEIFTKITSKKALSFTVSEDVEEKTCDNVYDEPREAVEW